MEPLIEGFLCKRGPTISYRWERRFCVLTASQLSWFRDERKLERVGYVDNTPETAATPFTWSDAPGDSIKHANQKPFGFAFDPDPSAGKQRRIFYFDAEDEDTMNSWIDAVQENGVEFSNAPANTGTSEIAIVEIGDDGALIRRDGSVRAHDQADAIYLVLDPRALPNIDKAGLRSKFQDVASKTTVFVLLPSQTSRPEFLLFAEISMQYLSCICDIFGPDIDYTGKKVRAVRLDDYMYHGEKILELMMAKDALFYPEEEKVAVLGLMQQFEPQIWNFRAWAHWCIGFGREEGEILGIQQQVYVPMIMTAESCPFAFPDDPLPAEFCGTRAILGTARTALFIAFNNDAAGRYSSMFGQDVVECKNATEFMLDDACSGDRYAIFLVEQSDLAWTAGEYGCAPMIICEKYREKFPDYPLTVVLLYDDYDSLVRDKWLVLALHCYIENCDNVIFATVSEAPQVSTFFTKAKYQSENVARALAMNFCAFPRLHFFTMSTAMGMEIAPASIMFPALTVGQQAGGVPPELFKAASGNFAMALTDQERKPLMERLLPAEEGNTATVIMPAMLIIKILSDLTKQTFGQRSEESNSEQPPVTMASIYGDEFVDCADDMQLMEVRENVEGLMMEYQAYFDIAIEESGPPETTGKDNQTARAIIEIGDDGALRRCDDASMTLQDVGEILLVLDPRSPRNIMMAKLREQFAGLESKTTIFLLMPSQSSSPESLLCVEIALQFLSCVSNIHNSSVWNSNLELKKIRIVRIDDWLHLRETILLQMMSQGMLYYPAEERDAMLNLLNRQFAESIFRYRAWCHWVIGEGVEEAEITEVHKALLIPMLESEYGLSCIERAPLDVSSKTAIQGSAQKQVFVAFSEEAATRYSAEFGIGVVPCLGFDESENLWTGVECPIFLVESADLAFSPGTYGCTPMKVCSRYRESYPSAAVTIVFLYEDFESFLNDKWLVPALHSCIEICDNVIFATKAEAAQIGDFFGKAKNNSENVARALCMSFVAFPRLCFFTLSTSMGQELEPGSILFPALTVGSPAGSGIPVDMFTASGGSMAMMLSDTDGRPLVDRVLPAAEGVSVTMIAQAKLIMKLVTALVDRTFGVASEESNCDLPPAEWASIFGEQFRGIADDAALQEARDNLRDLVTEYSCYMEAGQEDQDEYEDEYEDELNSQENLRAEAE